MRHEIDVLEFLMNSLNQGIIFLDNNKNIQICNQKAKQITGIEIKSKATHPAGKLQEGDIVIIADNKLGADDGEFGPEELKLLNIRDKSIKEGDMFVGVGVYKNKDIKSEYKFFQSNHLNLSLTLDTMYLGFHIVASVDDEKKMITIKVNDKTFRMPFFYAVGHAVVIDGNNGDIKFFQAKGYSIRHEETGTLLRGASWSAKKPDSVNTVDVIGKNVLDFFESSRFTDEVFDVLSGNLPQINNTLYEMNRRPVICSIIPCKRRLEDIDRGILDNYSEEPTGVFIAMQDFANIESVIKDKNDIIRQIEAQQEKYDSKPEDGYEYPEEMLNSFIGKSSKTKEVKYLAYKASKGSFNVIITGESGTGKSKLAREIHTMGNPKAPFVEVNCNAIAPSLFESELFGYVGGAFTGAKSEGKKGFFESANGGTIFLDEIGEIPLDIQVKLLHVLQNKIIYRVGSSKPVKVDVRVICATNKNLEEEVAKGNFRQDLFYRINVFSIEIPPIRERKEDLYLLINQLLKQVCDNYGLEQKQLSGDAIQKMVSYSWPGNVREMENAIERAVTLCDSKTIYSEHLKIGNGNVDTTLKALLAKEEAKILESSLLKFNGDKQKAMTELGVSKSVFYEKLKKYGIK